MASGGGARGGGGGSGTPDGVPAEVTAALEAAVAALLEHNAATPATERQAPLRFIAQHLLRHKGEATAGTGTDATTAADAIAAVGGSRR